MCVLSPFKEYRDWASVHVPRNLRKLRKVNLVFRKPFRYKWASGGSDSKESACSVGDLGSIPVSGRKWQPTPGFLPGESHGHGVAKSQTWLSDFTFTFFRYNYIDINISVFFNILDEGCLEFKTFLKMQKCLYFNPKRLDF